MEVLIILIALVCATGYQAWLPTTVALGLGYRAWKVRRATPEEPWIAEQDYQVQRTLRNYRTYTNVCLGFWFVGAVFAAVLMGRVYYSWGASIAALVTGYEVWRAYGTAAEDPRLFQKRERIAGNLLCGSLMVVMLLGVFVLDKVFGP